MPQPSAQQASPQGIDHNTTTGSISSHAAASSASGTRNSEVTKSGVRGWVLAVCIYLAVVNPVTFLLRYINAGFWQGQYSGFAKISDTLHSINRSNQDRGLSPLGVPPLIDNAAGFRAGARMYGVRKWLDLMIMVLSLYVGIQLWRKHKLAVQHAKTYPITEGIYIVFATVVLPNFWNLTIQQDAAWVIGWHIMPISMIYAYLKRSRRVLATYAH